MVKKPRCLASYKNYHPGVYPNNNKIPWLKIQEEKGNCFILALFNNIHQYLLANKLVIHCYIKNYPKTQHLKITNIYYLILFLRARNMGAT